MKTTKRGINIQWKRELYNYKKCIIYIYIEYNIYIDIYHDLLIIYDKRKLKLKSIMHIYKIILWELAKEREVDEEKGERGDLFEGLAMGQQ